MKKIMLSAAAVASVALLAGMWAGPEPEETNLSSVTSALDSPPKGPQIAGTWYSSATVVDLTGVPIPGADINVLATYDFKGGLTSTDTTDSGGHPLFTGLDSPGHGAWNMDGNELTSVIISLAYDEDGIPTGATRLTAVQVFDPQNPDVAVGTWFAEGFGVGEDPLGPPRQPGAGGGIVSRRLVVGK